MIVRCEECNHILAGDEVEHLYKGKSYCEDCYKDQNCMTGLKRIIKLTTEIADKVSDPRTKLQAFAQLTEGYKYIMELTTGGVIITDAIKYVQGQMNHLNKTEKAVLQNIQERKNEEQPEDLEQEQPTTNGVF